MPFRWNPREQLALCAYVLKWALIAVPVGVVIGSAVALFLWSLEAATACSTAKSSSTSTWNIGTSIITGSKPPTR